MKTAFETVDIVNSIFNPSTRFFLTDEYNQMLKIIAENQNFKILVVGAPGVGKTTLLKHLAESNKSCFFIAARELEQCIQNNQNLGDIFPSADKADIIFIDGLDEMIEYQQIYRILNSINHNRIVCSARPMLPFRENTFTQIFKIDFASKAAQFEVFVAEFFLSCFENVKIISQAHDKTESRYRYDYLVNDIPVEVKYSRTGQLIVLGMADSFHKKLKSDGSNKIFLISNCYYTDENEYNTVKQKYAKDNIELILLNHLLYIVEQTDAKLITKLNACLGFSTANIIRNRNLSLFKSLKLKPRAAILNAPPKISEVLIPYGAAPACHEYEKYCYDVINFLFSDSLGNIKEQSKINDDLGQVDFIATIKETPSDFWKLIYDRFRTNFIVFEAKNYKDPIKQNNIYITEKYLYDTALRNVAIIFTRKGADENAIRALNGCLREHGKLFIILDDIDVNKLIDIRIENLNKTQIDVTPSKFLLDKANELLISLGK